MSSSFELGDVDRLTVGTVGEPGRRVFYLQAVSGSQVVSLKLEKQQVAALVTYLATLLSDLPGPGSLPTDLDLVEPVLQEWAVGALGVSYDEAADRVLVQAEELMEEESDDGATARFLATREQVAALAARGAEVISAGRPPCPLCGQPLDPEGHMCVRLNGHRSQSR
ncbi:MAG: hypothetical protein QOG43_668 [Actinomycetota bacterium]|jgi:uncharacterized repeat protein (TIGR03847 family)|nr:hypothetical protein [Actinomycetota bacterium]